MPERPNSATGARISGAPSMTPRRGRLPSPTDPSLPTRSRRGCLGSSAVTSTVCQGCLCHIVRIRSRNREDRTGKAAGCQKALCRQARGLTPSRPSSTLMGIMEADFLGPRATFTGLAGDSLGADAAVEEPDGDTLDATLMDRDHFQGPCEYQATCL